MKRISTIPDKIFNHPDGNYYVGEKVAKNKYINTWIGGKTEAAAKKAWKEYAQKANRSNAAMLKELQSWDGR